MVPCAAIIVNGLVYLTRFLKNILVFYLLNAHVRVIGFIEALRLAP
jgi:hypothetical protein